jgi:hypothetical protein
MGEGGRLAFSETVDKVKTLMSGLSLRAPAWAEAVPDDVLLERLMAGISSRHHATATGFPISVPHSSLPNVQSSGATPGPSTKFAPATSVTAVGTAGTTDERQRKTAPTTGSGDNEWTAQFDE